MQGSEFRVNHGSLLLRRGGVDVGNATPLAIYTAYTLQV